MNILVLNGSPKGKYSTTLQTVLYLQKLNPGHNFEILNVSSTIKALEKDFSSAISAMRKAELIIFSYPVYTFLVPSQLHRFIELTKESGLDLSGKFASQITTSKHFYDVTAHRFIQDNCQDMGMKFINGLSADMDDLLTEKGQKEARDFFSYIMWCVSSDIYEPLPRPVSPAKHMPVTVPHCDCEKSGNVVIVADAADDNNLIDLIARFRAVLPYKTTLVNIHDFPFKGGCLSCFNCAVDGKCIYADGFDTFLRENIQTAQAIVIAFSIRDHSMGSIFKTYDDRQFCNGHRTVTMGIPFGYLISGNYDEEYNLNMVVNARADVGGNFLAGVACDQNDPDLQVDILAEKLSYAVKNRYIQPQSFFGVGGMKIFRDLIWLMQGMMKADHRFYKSHGQYDFPQKKRGTMLKMYLVGALMSNKDIKKKMGNKMNEGMIAPYKKVIDSCGKD